MVDYVRFLFLVYAVSEALVACPPSTKACQEGTTCHPVIGCIAVTLRQQAILDCHGVCINTTATPTLRCFNVPCPGNPQEMCGEIRDFDRCFGHPIIPTNGSCAIQGEPIACPNFGFCDSPFGCPSPDLTDPPALLPPSDPPAPFAPIFIPDIPTLTDAPTSTPTTSPTAMTSDNDDKTAFIIFFLLYGTLVLLILLVLGLRKIKLLGV